MRNLLNNWMLAIIFIFGIATGITSCVIDDNAIQPTAETTEEENIPDLEIDPSEFQPIDISVALLGSLSSYAEEEATRYWFTNVTNAVTDETIVVITDEITADNKAAIASVLERFGTMLLLEPKADNVKQYAKELGVDPNADYSKLELLGLTGFGDQFLSYNNGEDKEASDETLAPTSIASDDIWDIAPEEYLRLKAFAQWVDRIDKKYTEYQAYLEEREKAIIAADAELETGGSLSRAMTRTGEDEEDSGILNLANLPGIDRSTQAFSVEKDFKSFHNAGRSDDKDTCTLSVTCNYHFIPLYKFPEGKEPGSDYYIVQASVGWDCTEMLKGWKKHPHGTAARDRRSFLFFPLECKFWSEPKTTSGNYQVHVTADGGLWPGDVKAEKTVTNNRSFNLDGNVSGGFSGGREKGKTGDQATSSSSLSGNIDASIGIGANWSKEETFTVTQYEVSPYISNSKVGHIITVPGGEDGWHPRLISKVNGGIEVPNGVNFKKSLPVSESWIWRVSGTQVNTDDEALSVQFSADVKVGWYSYFYSIDGLDEQIISTTIHGEKVGVPAPNRTDAGFLKITASTVEEGKQQHIFGVKVIDVTDANNPTVYSDEKVSRKYGKTLTLGLPANRTYSIELQMGAKRSEPKTYVLADNWTVKGRETEELDTDIDFELKK